MHVTLIAHSHRLHARKKGSAMRSPSRQTPPSCPYQHMYLEEQHPSRSFLKLDELIIYCRAHRETHTPSRALYEQVRTRSFVGPRSIPHHTRIERASSRISGRSKKGMLARPCNTPRFAICTHRCVSKVACFPSPTNASQNTAVIYLLLKFHHWWLSLRVASATDSSKRANETIQRRVPSPLFHTTAPDQGVRTTNPTTLHAKPFIPRITRTTLKRTPKRVQTTRQDHNHFRYNSRDRQKSLPRMRKQGALLSGLLYVYHAVHTYARKETDAATVQLRHRYSKNLLT